VRTHVELVASLGIVPVLAGLLVILSILEVLV